MTSAFIAVALIIGAPLVKSPPPRADQYLGRWTAEALLLDGKASPQHQGLEYEFTKDGTWTIYRDGQPISSNPRSYKTDTKTKPIAIDLTENGGTMAGIVKIEGDTLTVAFRTRQGGDRPKDFDTDQAAVMMVVMKRVKEK